MSMLPTLLDVSSLDQRFNDYCSVIDAQKVKTAQYGASCFGFETLDRYGVNGSGGLATPLIKRKSR